MLYITHPFLIGLISIFWLLVRSIICFRQKEFRWKREIPLLLVYICLIVVARYTFFPFSKVDGQVQPLVFDPAHVFPFRINLIPFVFLTDYPDPREIILNLVGNVAMFIPIGVIWPLIFRELNTHKKAIAAGAGFSLCIEILQLPFFDRVSDIEDLILNTIGYLIGYSIYLLAAHKKRCVS